MYVSAQLLTTCYAQVRDMSVQQALVAALEEITASGEPLSKLERDVVDSMQVRSGTSGCE